MNSTDLMRNLCWLGHSNKIMKLANNSDDDSSDHDVVDLEDDNSDSELVGRGIQPRPPIPTKRRRKKIRVDDDRIIRWAMPEMDTTLRNWTLHRQSLGKMLRNYRREYRDLPPPSSKGTRSLFNTTSAVLSTIGSMTKNSILRSVQFDKMGGSYNNAPQPKLPPTDINLSRYVAFFQTINQTMDTCWSPTLCLVLPSFCPTIPHTQIHKSFFHQNPTFFHQNPVIDKEYSTDDNSSTTDESVDFSPSEERDEENSDSEQSYV